MLVLSRKNRETVVIDGCITVKVLQIKGNTIRLGIDAPKDMSVRRGELLQEVTIELAPQAGAEENDSAAPVVPGLPFSIGYTCAAS